VLFVLLVGAFVFDRLLSFNEDISIKQSRYSSSIMMFLFVFVLSLFLSFIVFDYERLLEVGKSAVSGAGARYSFFVWCVLFLASISAFSENRKFFIISVFFIFVSLFVGARSYFATFLIIIFLVVLRNRRKQVLALNLKYIIGGAFSFVFIFAYKLIYNIVGTFNFNEIVSALSNKEAYLFRVFQGSEASLIMVNLNSVIDRYNEFGANADYFSSLFFRCFPFVSSQLAEIFGVNLVRFSKVLDQEFYETVSYGMGSSIWGEAIYSGGWVLFVVFVLLFVFMIFLGSAFIYSKQFDIKIGFFMVPLVYCSFYAHRIEISFVLYSFYISIFCYLFFKLLSIFFVEASKEEVVR
jgi:hypothetical protein